MSLNYSSLLSKAWNITWKYKVLWFFGFLAAFGGVGWGNSGGGSSSPSFNFNNNSSSVDYPRGDIPRNLQPAYDQLANIDINTWITIGVVVLCSLLLLVLVFWLLSIIGRGGLIGGILAADNNDKVTFREAWNIGTKNFWRLFLIRMIRIIVSLMILIVIFLPTLLLGILTCGLGFIPMICVGFVIGIVAKVWFVYMDYAVIMEKRGIGEAIGRAWSILGDNIGPIAILYIILFAVSLGVGLGLLILFVPAGVTVLLSLLPLITGSGSVNMALLVAGIVLIVLFIVISWVVQAVETVWETAVMVLAYREFIQKSPLPLAATPEGQPQITV
jgi:hypothetical protein